MDGEWAAEEVHTLPRRHEGPVRDDVRACLLLELRHGMASRTAHVSTLSTERASATCVASADLIFAQGYEARRQQMNLSAASRST
jgi:hypothetical protein